MKNHIVNFRVSLLSRIHRKIENSQVLSNLIIFSHSFWIIIILTKFQILHSCTESQECQSLKSTIMNNIFNQNLIFNIYLSFLSSILILVLIILIVYLCIREQNILQTQKSKIIGFLSNFTVLNYMIAQITIFPAFYYVIQQKEINFMQKFVISSFIILGYYVLNSIFPNFSLFHKFTCLILIAVSINQSWVSQIIILLTTIFNLIGPYEKFRKIKLTIISILNIKGLQNQFFSQQLILNSVSEGIYNIIIIFLAFGYVFCFNGRPVYRSDQNFHEDIFKKTYKIQLNSVLKDWFTLNEMLIIFSFFNTQAKKLAPFLSEKNFKQLSSEITIQNFHQIHLFILNQAYKKSPSILFKILILQLQIKMKKNLMTILTFKNLKEPKFQQITWYEKIRLYEIEQKLIFNYGQFGDKKRLFVTDITRNYRKIEDFKANFNKLIKIQIKFWQKLLKSNINQQELLYDFENIELQRLKLKFQDQQLLRLNIYDQTQLLFEQQQLKIFQYQSFYENQSASRLKKSIKKTQESLGLQNIDQIQLLEQNSENSFIIISDDRVSFVSSSLANKLKRIKIFEFEIDQIFGVEFSYFLKNQLSSIKYKHKNQWIPLPLFIDKYSFLQSTARIFWLPSKENKTKFLIKICLLESQPFIIYNTNKKLIQFYSENLIIQFNLCEKSVRIQIEKHELRFQRLFLSSFQDFFPYLKFDKSKKRNQSFIETKKIRNYEKIYIDGLIDNKIKDCKKDHQIKLQVWEWIDIKQEKLVIIQMKNKDFKSIQRNQEFQPMKNKMKQLTLNDEKIDQKNFEDQDKFSDHINGTFSMLKMNKISKRIVIPFMLIFIIGSISITTNIMDLKLFNNRIKLYNSTIEEITLGSQCFILLYRMYKRAGKNYQYLAYPENFQQSMGISLKQAIKSVKQNQRTFLDIFLSKYLQSLQFKTKKINYNLSFKEFKITTNTQLPTFIDFAQHFLKNIQLDQYDFILQNYPSFRKLATDFQNSSFLEEIIALSNSNLHLQGYIFLSALIVIFIILFFLELKNRMNVDKILKVYCHIANQQIIKKISELQSYAKMPHKQNKCEIMEQIEAIPLLHQLQKDQRSFKEEKAKTKKMINSKFLSLVKYLKFISILSLFLINFTIQNLVSDREMKIGSQFINYHSLVYKNLVQINRINTDTGLASIFRHKFGKKLDLQQGSITINGRLQYLSEYQEIKAISLKIFTLMESDLCKFTFSNGVQLIPCQDYANGFLTRGYSQSYNHMLTLAKQLQTMDLSQFNTQKCTLNYCPSYYVFDQISLRINCMFEALLSKLSSQKNNLFQEISNKYMKALIIKIVFSILAILLLTILVCRGIKNSSKALRLFIYVPTEIVNSTKVMTYLKKNNFINFLEDF